VAAVGVVLLVFEEAAYEREWRLKRRALRDRSDPRMIRIITEHREVNSSWRLLQNWYDTPNSTMRGGMMAVGSWKLAPERRFTSRTVFELCEEKK
jgi:hypothetical protein